MVLFFLRRTKNLSFLAGGPVKPVKDGVKKFCFLDHSMTNWQLFLIYYVCFVGNRGTNYMYFFDCLHGKMRMWKWGKRGFENHNRKEENLKSPEIQWPKEQSEAKRGGRPFVPSDGADQSTDTQSSHKTHENTTTNNTSN
jgi:hypothetical protein